MEKKCTKCKRDLPLNSENFNKSKNSKDGFFYRCRDCEKERKRKEYYGGYNEKMKTHRENNKELYAEKHKTYYENNKERLLNYDKEYKKIYVPNRKKIDPLYKLNHNIRSLINGILKKKRVYKKNKTVEILGCSFEEFKLHLESKFEPWMNWGNYGLYNGELNYGWDIDHIIPASSALNEAEVYKLNHYTNLQPLCSRYNRHIKKDLILA